MVHNQNLYNSNQLIEEDITMKFKEAIRNIEDSNQWGIYAELPLTIDSEVRIGQTHFENGGLLDSKEFIINGEQVNRNTAIFYDNVDGLIEDNDTEEMDAAMDNWIEDELIPQLIEDYNFRLDMRGW